MVDPLSETPRAAFAEMAVAGAEPKEFAFDPEVNEAPIHGASGRWTMGPQGPLKKVGFESPKYGL